MKYEVKVFLKNGDVKSQRVKEHSDVKLSDGFVIVGDEDGYSIYISDVVDYVNVDKVDKV